jgi:hypothetical protein
MAEFFQFLIYYESVLFGYLFQTLLCRMGEGESKNIIRLPIFFLSLRGSMSSRF